MAESAGTLAEAFVRIRSDDSMARAGMSKFRGAFQGQMAGLQKMAVITLSVVGLGAGIRGIWNLGKSLVMAGDEIESLRNSFATMLKTKGLADAAGQADELIDKARKFTAVTPFTEAMTSKAVSAFLPFSNDMDDLFEKITSIGEAASVSAEGLQAFPRISRGISQMFAKSKIQAEEMMQLAEAGIPAWQTLAKAMNMSVAEVMAIGKKGELGMDAINKFVKQLGSDFAGNMAKQAQTVGGLTTTIVDTVRAKMVQAMAPIRDLVQGAFSKIAAFVQSDEFAGVMERVKGIIASIADVISRALKSPLARTAMMFGAIALSAGVVAGIVGMIGTAMAVVAPIAGPVLAIMTAIGTAAFVAKKAWDAAMNSDKAEAIRESLSGVWNDLKLIGQNIKSTFESVTSSIGTAFGGIGVSVSQIGGWVLWATKKLESLTTWIGVFSSNWQATWSVVKLSMQIAVLTIKERFFWMWDQIKVYTVATVMGIGGLINWLADRWQDVLGAIVEVATIHWAALGAGLSAAFQAIEWDKLADAFGNLIKIWGAHQAGLNNVLGTAFELIFKDWESLLGRMLNSWMDLTLALPTMLIKGITAGIALQSLVLSDLIDDLAPSDVSASAQKIRAAKSGGPQAPPPETFTDKIADAYTSGFKSVSDKLNITQTISEALGSIGSNVGEAARTAVSAALGTVDAVLERLRDSFSGAGDAFKAEFDKALEDKDLTFEESEALKKLDASRSSEVDELKKAYDARKKLLAEQRKLDEEDNKNAEAAASKWGDDAAKANADAADAAAKDKSRGSESVGIVALQKKMQDIFGGRAKDPVVNAVEKGNAILGQIRDGGGANAGVAANVNARGENAGMAYARRRGAIMDPEKMTGLHTPFQNIANTASSLLGSATSAVSGMIGGAVRTITSPAIPQGYGNSPANGSGDPLANRKMNIPQSSLQQERDTRKREYQEMMALRRAMYAQTKVSEKTLAATKENKPKGTGE